MVLNGIPQRRRTDMAVILVERRIQLVRCRVPQMLGSVVDGIVTQALMMDS